MYPQVGRDNEDAIRGSAEAIASRDVLDGSSDLPSEKQRPKLSIKELAFRSVAALRAHPHVSNVLTHISSAKWDKVEQSLATILDLTTTSSSLSLLEENIIDLMCADRGVTGKLLKPYFRTLLYKLLEPHEAKQIIHHTEVLFLELQLKAEHPPQPAPGSSEQGMKPCLMPISTNA
jgi:hypothetical protein